MRKAIVFYCKNCGELFFACIKDPLAIKNSKKEINQYLIEGHRIAEVDIEEVQVKFGSCKCDNQQLSFAKDTK